MTRVFPSKLLAASVLAISLLAACRGGRKTDPAPAPAAGGTIATPPRDSAREEAVPPQLIFDGQTLGERFRRQRACRCRRPANRSAEHAPRP